MDTTRFAGKVGIVTGGAGGIGLAIAERFVAEGGKIILQYLPHELIGNYFSEAESEAPDEPAEPDTGDTYPEWVQPTGAHDAYNTGDRVTYNGRVYESTMDGNTWSPDAYPQGWEDLGEVTA